MKEFESVIILKPVLKKEKIKDTLKKVDEIIERIAKITNKEELGLKKLAYEVRGNKEGYYVVHEFELNEDYENYSQGIDEIERQFRTLEEIIKFIVVKRD